MTLTEIFALSEMARPKGEAGWAILDWAAQQEGTFTIDDLWKVWQQAGGGGGLSSFHTTIGHLTAKPWKDDQEKYAVSEKRPFVLATRGRQGKGQKHVYQWGLDGPLREPPPPQDAEDQDSVGGGDDDSDAIGIALDRLEKLMDRLPLKAALNRWKGMNDLDKIIDDIRKTVPARGRLDAVHIAGTALLSKKVTPAEMQDAEAELRGGLPLQTKKAEPPDISIDDDDPTDPDIDAAPDDDEPEEEDPAKDFDFDGEWETGSDTDPDVKLQPEPQAPPPKPAPAAPPAKKSPFSMSKLIKKPKL
jgi:hypothetical protein